MHANLSNIIMLLPKQPFRRRIFTIPILTAVCWVCLQKGCVWNPDLSPAQALLNTAAAVTEPVPVPLGRDKGLPPHIFSVRKDGGLPGTHHGSPNWSLRQASSLLRRAAAMLDKNDRTALRLILQAIAILKHEIMRGADGPEYDRISSAPFSPERQGSWPDTQALLSLLRYDLIRYESGLQPDRQLATELPPSQNTDRSTNR